MTQQDVSQYPLYVPGSANALARYKGMLTGEIAGANETFGIEGAATEVLNQNGYLIRQNPEDGQFYVTKELNTNIASPNWFSQTLDLMPYANTSSNLKDTSNLTSTIGSNTSSINDAYNAQCQSIMSDYLANVNKYSDNSNTDGFVSTNKEDELKSYEAIDPVTGKVVNKEKSEKIDEMLQDRATVNKFERIAKLINKTYDKQNGEGDGISVEGAVGGAIGAAAGLGVAAGGAAIGAKVGGIAGTILGPLGTAAGALIGGAVGAIAGFFVGKHVDAHNDAAQAGDNLEKALTDLSDEEKVAFERYYNETYGTKVADTLMMLETDEDSSCTQQASGLDYDTVEGLLVQFDDASKKVLEFQDGEKEAYEEAEENDTDAAVTDKKPSLRETTQYQLNQTEYTYLLNIASKVRAGAQIDELTDQYSSLSEIESRLATLAMEIENYNN